MATLKDVAALAGVSVSTVSRVINNCERVDPATRSNVERAIKIIGYEPNEIARRLKTNTSDVYGVIVPDITNTFFATVVRGVERAAAEAGFSVLLCDTDSNAGAEERSLSLLLRQKVAGIITASVAEKNIYSGLDTKIVYIDNVPDNDHPSVTIDNRQAARELTQTLIKRGCKRIFAITGPDSESSGIQRKEGFLDAMKLADLKPVGIFEGDNKTDSGYTAIKKLHEAPDAVFAANNFMAYGAVKALEERGITVPENVLAAAFDVPEDIPFGRKKFISVLSPAFKIGEAAASLLAHGGGSVILGHEIY